MTRSLAVTRPTSPTRTTTSIGFVVAALTTSLTAAAPPKVHFDVRHMVNCRDVTPESFAAINPHTRLVEARFQVSTLIQHGTSHDLLQFLYRMRSPHHSFEVVDYEPKTTLATQVAGKVGIEQKDEKTKSLGIDVSGCFDHFAKARATGGANVARKSNSSVRYELLPPLELLAASGTIQRGEGVYFKLKPSKRTSLEGSKDFVVVLRVPTRWRADIVHVQCQAFADYRSLAHPLDGKSVCGRGDFVIALYQDGDASAKAAAQRLVRAEQTLRYVANLRKAEITKQRFPTIAHRLGGLVQAYTPKLPAQWLDEIIFGPPGAARLEIEPQLAGPTHQATSQFLTAKEQLTGMNARTDEPVDH